MTGIKDATEVSRPSFLFLYVSLYASLDLFRTFKDRRKIGRHSHTRRTIIPGVHCTKDATQECMSCTRGDQKLPVRPNDLKPVIGTSCVVRLLAVLCRFSRHLNCLCVVCHVRWECLSPRRRHRFVKSSQSFKPHLELSYGGRLTYDVFSAVSFPSALSRAARLPDTTLTTS